MSNPQPTAPPAPAPLPRPAPQPAPSPPPPGTIPPERPTGPTTAMPDELYPAGITVDLAKLPTPPTMPHDNPWRFNAALAQAQTLVRPTIDELAAMLYHLSFPRRIFTELSPMAQWSYRMDAQRLLVLLEQEHA